MASFVLSFFPLDVLDEVWDVIESVSVGFLTYSSKHMVGLTPPLQQDLSENESYGNFGL